MADVVLMTATPFRGDRYVLQGKVVYKNCSFERAIKNVYVKNVVFEPVPISGIDGIDENGKGFSLQGIGEMLGKNGLSVQVNGFEWISDLKIMI